MDTINWLCGFALKLFEMRPILNCTLYLTEEHMEFFQLRGNVGQFRGTGDNPAE